MVLNGYELTENRARDYLATRPYYVYQLQVMAPRNGPIRSWDDLTRPGPEGRPWKVGVLVNSAGDIYANENGGPAPRGRPLRRRDRRDDRRTATASAMPLSKTSPRPFSTASASPS